MGEKHKLTTAILDAFEDGIYVMDRNLVVEYMKYAMGKTRSDDVRELLGLK